MTRYISGISIISFASFLAWTGLVCSLIFILGSLDMIFTPLALDYHLLYSRYGYHGCDFLCGSLYGVGAVVLVINIGMFIYSFRLWKAITSDNMVGLRNLIKVGCYIMGGMELLTCAAGIIPPIYYIMMLSFFSHRTTGTYIGLFTMPIIVSVGFMALISLMIHGVRKFKPALVNIYIIFKIVLFALFAILTLDQFIMGLISIGGLGWMLGINQFLLCGFFYFYSSGFMVVQYNLMLGKPTEQGSLDLTHSSPLQFSNNVYLNDNTNNLA